MSSPCPRKLVDYTKQRGNHHLCAKNRVLTAMTKAFLSHKQDSCKSIPSMVTISASRLDTTDTYAGCGTENAELNDFLLQVSAKRRQPTSDSRERFQCSRSPTHERLSTVFEADMSINSLDAACTDSASIEPIDFLLKIPPFWGVASAPEMSAPEISMSSLDLDEIWTNTGSVEPIDFFLKIPPRTWRQRSDLRQRFQSSRSPSHKKASILQSILSESSTTSLASRRLPSSSTNSDSFRTIQTNI